MSNQMPDFAPMIQNYFQNIPFGGRILCLIVMVTFFVDTMFYNTFIKSYGGIAEKIIEGEIWRIFTATYIINGFLNLLITTFILVSVTNGIERTVGSLHFLMDFVGKSFLINFLTFLYNLSLAPIQPLFLLNLNYGLWPMIIYYQASKCIASPYAKTKIIVEIPNYLLCGLIVFCIILIDPSISNIISMQIAFVEQIWFDGMFLRMQKETITKLEGFRFCSQFITFSSYKQPAQNPLEPKVGKPVQIGTDEQIAQPQVLDQKQNDNYQQLQSILP